MQKFLIGISMCFIIMASIVHNVFFLFLYACTGLGGRCMFPSTFLLLLLFVLLVLLLHHHHSSSSSSSSFLLLLLSSLLYYSLPTIMATSASLFIEALSNLYIVVTYLCIKGWWLLVNKVVHAAHYLVACTHIGYGRLAHSFLSAIFILLAVPDLLSSWLLAWSALVGTGLLALTAVAAQPAPLDPGPLDSSRCYVDTATTAFFTNNEAMLAGLPRSTCSSTRRTGAR